MISNNIYNTILASFQDFLFSLPQNQAEKIADKLEKLN